MRGTHTSRGCVYLAQVWGRFAAKNHTAAHRPLGIYDKIRVKEEVASIFRPQIFSFSRVTPRFDEFIDSALVTSMLSSALIDCRA